MFSSDDQISSHTKQLSGKKTFMILQKPDMDKNTAFTTKSQVLMNSKWHVCRSVESLCCMIMISERSEIFVV